MSFPDWAFIANNAVSLAIVLSPVEVAALYLVFKMKRSLDLILGPIQTNPLLKTVWAMMNQFNRSSKMTELGRKGVEARQFQAVMSEEQGLVIPLVGEALKSWVKERFGPKAEAKIAAAIDMVPVNADPIIFANLPQIAERLGGLMGKGAEAKALAEELKMLTKVGAEPAK